MQKFIKLGNYIFNLEQVVLVTLFDELGQGSIEGSPATTISLAGDSAVNFMTVTDPAEREALQQILRNAGYFDSGNLVEKIRANQGGVMSRSEPTDIDKLELGSDS